MPDDVRPIAAAKPTGPLMLLGPYGGGTALVMIALGVYGRRRGLAINAILVTLAFAAYGALVVATLLGHPPHQ